MQPDLITSSSGSKALQGVDVSLQRDSASSLPMGWHNLDEPGTQLYNCQSMLAAGSVPRSTCGQVSLGATPGPALAAAGLGARACGLGESSSCRTHMQPAAQVPHLALLSLLLAWACHITQVVGVLATTHAGRAAWGPTPGPALAAAGLGAQLVLGHGRLGGQLVHSPLQAVCTLLLPLCISTPLGCVLLRTLQAALQLLGLHGCGCSQANLV